MCKPYQRYTSGHRIASEVPDLSLFLPSKLSASLLSVGCVACPTLASSGIDRVRFVAVIVLDLALERP